MKAIFTVAMLFGLCSILSAKEEKADPVGRWKCEYEVGGQNGETHEVDIDGTRAKKDK